jgi:DNA repair protein RecN (Recombination protein N)
MKKSSLYLSSLRLNNFATFRDEEIFFENGFNAIIGETGSGKSLVLDALQLAFGMRADKKSVRKGNDFAIIEATFSNVDQNVIQYLTQINYPCDGDEIILKRIITSTGSSKAFLNFQQCSIQTLADFSRRFTDLVGQFENQKLLSETYQLKLLDTYAKIEKEVASYTTLYQEIETTKNELSAKQLLFNELQQKKDYIEFQIKELEELNPTSEDEASLLSKKDELLIGQNFQESISKAINTLSEDDNYNISELLHTTCKDLERIPSDKIQHLQSRLLEAHAIIQETSYELQGTIDTDIDPLEIEFVIDRLDKYQRLKRKFQLETHELEDLLLKFKNELNELEVADNTIEQLNKRHQSLIDQAYISGKKIHKVRTEAATRLSKELTNAVRQLKMNGATINLEVQKSEVLLKSGITKINFIAETNPGEGYYKVKDVASGGELSRILLSLRQILSSTDTVSIFLFDEIDTGVGGETAIAVGKALSMVSKKSQVIAITHLPQIAHHADTLQIVKKETIKEQAGERTISITEKLTEKLKNDYVQSMTSII